MTHNISQEYATILVLDGELKGHSWALKEEQMVLGRDESCDLVIPMRQISRQHIVFRRKQEHVYEVEDLDSRNGTWINGTRVEGVRKLSDQDEIHIALQVRLLYTAPGETVPVSSQLPDRIPSMGGTGRLKIDTEARQVFINGIEMQPPLSLPQYRLLELLYVNQGRVCSRDEVVDTVWPETMGEGVSEQAIDALVRRLRDRLSEVDGETQFVVTVRGHGFRLENPV